MLSQMGKDLAIQMQMLNMLRSDEGSSVTVYGPYPDIVDGKFPAVIDVYGWWTSWSETRYKGNDLFECLGAALSDKEKESKKAYRRRKP